MWRKTFTKCIRAVVQRKKASQPASNFPFFQSVHVATHWNTICSNVRCFLQYLWWREGSRTWESDPKNGPTCSFGLATYTVSANFFFIKSIFLSQNTKKFRCLSHYNWFQWIYNASLMRRHVVSFVEPKFLNMLQKELQIHHWKKNT